MTDHPGRPVGAELEQLRDGFGFTLRAERLSAGYSHQQLADHAGMTKRAVIYLEAGERRPTSDAIRVLAYVLRRPLKRDTGPAEDLAAQLRALAGDSLRQPEKTGRARRDLIEHLTKFGLTRAERFQESERILQDTLADANLDSIAKIEAMAKRRGVDQERLDMIARAKEKAIEEGRYGPLTAIEHVRQMTREGRRLMASGR